MIPSCDSCRFTIVLLLGSLAAAQSFTALSDCHIHDGGVQYCIPQPTGTEMVVATVVAGQTLPSEYVDCHEHGSEGMFCVNPDTGADVAVGGEAHQDEDAHAHEEGDEHSTEDGDQHTADEEAAAESQAAAEGDTPEGCHYHSGKLHCPGASEASADQCETVKTSNSLGLRIGSIFIVLATSAFFVFFPIIIKKLPHTNLVVSFLKQFGAGVIVSTAFIHLLTHAQIMFADPCIGELHYESTATAIFMGGLFAAFLVQLSCDKYLASRGLSSPSHSTEEIPKRPSTTESDCSSPPTSLHDAGEKVSVYVMETGIVFHSVLIGLTLVLAPRSSFTQLLIVIIFHQGFEGMALGARIADLTSIASGVQRFLLAAGFAIVTPAGMAIGLGVRGQFDAGDSTTLWVMACLNAASAGVLCWVGVVEMWFCEWFLNRGGLKSKGAIEFAVGMVGLVGGFMAMGALGKWA